MAQINPADPVFSAAVAAVVARLGYGTGGTGGGSGSVTSVGLADASTSPIYGITNTPITIAGTLSMTLSTSTTPNQVFASNTSGVSSVQPSFRALTVADMPVAPGIGGTLTTFTQIGGTSQAYTFPAGLTGYKSFA